MLITKTIVFSRTGFVPRQSFEAQSSTKLFSPRPVQPRRGADE